MVEDHRKKKSSSSKGKSKVISVIAMKEVPIYIPKGPFKDHLEKIGQLKEIPFDRYMDVAEINQLLSNSFVNSNS